MKGMFDLSGLPKKAQKKLIDFYHFLVERYSKNKGVKDKELTSKKDRIDNFFDKYNLDLKEFTFNRSDIYDR
jgi:hypothetical protein